MSLKIPLTKKLIGKSDRVKDVDFHPTEPWVLSALYNGRVVVWDYKSRTVVKSFEVSKNDPIRCAKFIPRKNWIVTGSDDKTLRVFNYETTEKVQQIENAHSDFFRALIVHPTHPYIITCSDDNTIVIRDYSNDFSVVTTYRDHTGFVMSIAVNPKDPSLLASASTDGTVKVWGIPPPGQTVNSTQTSYFSLTGHEDGVNCVTYVTAGDRPYIVSGSDDSTVKVWDYMTKKCVATLRGHQGGVYAVAPHPSLPLIISAAEDCTVKVWHALKFSLEATHDLQLGRIWTMHTPPVVDGVAPASLYVLGGDEGTAVVQLGSEQPVVSLCEGQLVWAKGLELSMANLRMLDVSTLRDGERLRVPTKDLGPCVLFPKTLSHHPQSRFFAVCDEREFYVYAARSLRYKCFGKASEFQWAHNGQFAVRDASSADPNRVVVYSTDCEESFAFSPQGFGVERIFGGRLLAVKSDKDFVCFYDWAEGRLVRRIDIAGLYDVAWNAAGTRVALACADGIFTLSCDSAAIEAGLQSVHAGEEDEEDEGIEEAFDMLDEVNETACTSLSWASEECLVFTAAQGLKLCAAVGGSVDPIAHLDRPMTLLGPLQASSEADHVVLVETRDLTSVTTYRVSPHLARWQAAVVRRDAEQVRALWPLVPADCHEKAARFMLRAGMKTQALKLTSDLQLKFELATELGQLALAASLVRQELQQQAALHSEQGGLNLPPAAVALAKRKWGLLGDLALQQGALGLAEEAFEQADDLPSWLMVASCTGDAASLRRLLERAKAQGDLSTAFTAATLLNLPNEVIASLIASEEPAEAALFARTYAPSQAEAVVRDHWLPQLRATNPLLADATALPSAHKELFPDLDRTAHVEKALASRTARLGLGGAEGWVEAVEGRQTYEKDLVQAVKTAASPAEFMKVVAADVLAKYPGGIVPGAAPASAPVAKPAAPPAAPAAPAAPSGGEDASA